MTSIFEHAESLAAVVREVNGIDVLDQWDARLRDELERVGVPDTPDALAGWLAGVSWVFLPPPVWLARAMFQVAAVRLTDMRRHQEGE